MPTQRHHRGTRTKTRYNESTDTLKCKCVTVLFTITSLIDDIRNNNLSDGNFTLSIVEVLKLVAQGYINVCHLEEWLAVCSESDNTLNTKYRRNVNDDKSRCIKNRGSIRGLECGHSDMCLQPCYNKHLATESCIVEEVEFSPTQGYDTCAHVATMEKGCGTHILAILQSMVNLLRGKCYVKCQNVVTLLKCYRNTKADKEEDIWSGSCSSDYVNAHDEAVSNDVATFDQQSHHKGHLCNRAAPLIDKTAAQLRPCSKTFKRSSDQKPVDETKQNGDKYEEHTLKVRSAEVVLASLGRANLMLQALHQCSALPPKILMTKGRWLSENI